MSELSIRLDSTLPDGWHLTHLIFLDPDWQANAKNDEHVVVATGDTVEDAICNAGNYAEAGKYTGRLFNLGTTFIVPDIRESLTSLLGFQRKPPDDFKRRV